VNHTKLLPFILDYITAKDSKLGLSRRKFVENSDQTFHERAENFYHRYQVFIESQGKSLQFGQTAFYVSNIVWTSSGFIS
jgi:hypothetical protein